MVFVTMVDGSVRQYNNARTWGVSDTFLKLYSCIENKEKHTVGWLSMNDVKHIEFTQPCKTYEPKPRRKR